MFCRNASLVTVAVEDHYNPTETDAAGVVFNYSPIILYTVFQVLNVSKMLPFEVHSRGNLTTNIYASAIIEVSSVIADLIKVIYFGLPILLNHIFRTLVPPKLKNVSGQTVLISGGGNGLGRALALEFADRGCNVIVVDIDLKAAEQTCVELREKRVNAYAYRVDVSSYEQVQTLADDVHKHIGPVDILVNNAALVYFDFLQNTTPDMVNRTIDINVKSHMWTTKVFLEKMMERRRGHIVGISSMSGMYAFPWAVVYSTSKYAVNGFMAAITEQLRLQGFSNSIQTTCVCPYYIATRKDIVDFLKKPRFKLLTTEHTARVIIDGILRNQVTIAIPPFFDLGVRIMQLFPIKIQQLVRDYIIREYELNST
ncbi:17-beta-hydroxysteroid dehydrogenase 13-like [Wyeomyia smithii]|uniref:17-beta-hydroxysteroid dehydrogenase 13-like n=1 Tax=Wyeomyia smithii TaxID=174621 RepID=UPI002467D8B7|nr:17-beta-hydroxysteroid dehydrogenase 13-like [Wyeomyia smithii]